ncbi:MULTISPECIES: response regulator transcription factor [Pseudomonas]|jgi:DNA-binding CsgD family transcriptional regulator|uniref:response regulator transcription factor n=1 Tax=Pseudomonas TaxID=286 RepID=UPI000272C35E|nr:MULTISPECIES: helix-turn-helix transcriptional regulator [Pseudomonas]AUO22299.1 LuxR family transcriptional regulator [Pseudomonas sp. NC02]EJF72124.1 LuxR family transcriptional regulator [Pseudomonas sp. Ag1]MBT1266627.1 helix-turn-helix transcriptional regulator [Pseudomonas sp. VS38]MDQ0666919.1 DNA-binding CsgD family transcriptional regulator [Pseudomonas sp. W2I6]NVZ16395.1 helix-turn-helix transcriptional regulator [Pseudomonas sp. IPO3775]|eukprot:gene5067-5886_t
MSGSEPQEQPSTQTDSAPVANRKARAMLSGKPLTPKEREILHWAVEGKTVWEISRIRSISQATVKFHLRNIYGKLQVTNRVQAVNEAVKQGLCK